MKTYSILNLLLIFSFYGSCQCEISSDIRTVCEGDLVSFKVSTPLVFDKCLWVFGDRDSVVEFTGYSSYTFEKSGSIQVCASLFNSFDSLICGPIYTIINVNDKPNVDFDTVWIPSLCAPQAVKFLNRTTCNDSILSWFWDLEAGSGNSKKSGLKNPYHYYLQNDFFDVSLRAVSIFGCEDSLLKKDIIKLSGPKPKFWLYKDKKKVYTDTICLGESITVLDSSEDVLSWEFVKGDMTVFIDDNRLHFNIWEIPYTEKTGKFKLYLNAYNLVFYPTPAPGYWGRCYATFGIYNEESFKVVVLAPNSIIPATNNDAGIQLYPNPVINTLNIKIADNVNVKNISVINTMGQLKRLSRVEYKKRTEISIATIDFSPGMYFLHLTTENGTATKSFIVSK